ncbi:hypothetical protein ATKI12_0504 [Kitasatospora sp. Ki12]
MVRDTGPDGVPGTAPGPDAKARRYRFRPGTEHRLARPGTGYGQTRHIRRRGTPPARHHQHAIEHARGPPA